MDATNPLPGRSHPRWLFGPTILAGARACSKTLGPAGQLLHPDLPREVQPSSASVAPSWSRQKTGGGRDSRFNKWKMSVQLSSRPSIRFVPGRHLCVALAVVASSTSCVVWKDDYDVMAAKYRNESAAHTVAREDLAKQSEEIMKLQARVATLEASLAASNQRLDQNAESMARAEHEFSILEQQRTEATALVEQLRAEQQRLASHLQAYASDRAELNAERERLTGELQSAELRVGALTMAQKRAQARLALVRDLSLKLQNEISREQAELLFDGDVVVVRLDAARMFTDKGVSKDGKKLLASVGRALASDVAKGAKADPSSSTKTPKKDAPPIPTEPATSKEPPPRLVLSQWEKGQKLRDAAERLKLAAYELAVAGVEPPRFAHEKVLLAYQEGLRAVLTAPTPPAGEGDPNEPPNNPPQPTFTGTSLAVPGSSLVIHLVPQ